MDDSPRWFKSSYSNFATDCLEAAFTQPHWHKSSHSSMEGGDCVEAAFAEPRRVMVRDTQNRETAVLGIGTREWAGFMTVLADRRS